ncbi:MAG: hypothetical protein JO243_12830 [Solirubrobacterales bacterium]|nr:hypothetical protein [Solirubrobacterales bacterium]
MRFSRDDGYRMNGSAPSGKRLGQTSWLRVGACIIRTLPWRLWREDGAALRMSFAGERLHFCSVHCLRVYPVSGGDSASRRGSAPHVPYAGSAR